MMMMIMMMMMMMMIIIIIIKCSNNNFNGKYLATVGPKLSEPTGDPDKRDRCTTHFEYPTET